MDPLPYGVMLAEQRMVSFLRNLLTQVKTRLTFWKVLHTGEFDIGG